MPFDDRGARADRLLLKSRLMSSPPPPRPGPATTKVRLGSTPSPSRYAQQHSKIHRHPRCQAVRRTRQGCPGGYAIHPDTRTVSASKHKTAGLERRRHLLVGATVRQSRRWPGTEHRIRTRIGRGRHAPRRAPSPLPQHTATQQTHTKPANHASNPSPPGAIENTTTRETRAAQNRPRRTARDGRRADAPLTRASDQPGPRGRSEPPTNGGERP